MLFEHLQLDRKLGESSKIAVIKVGLMRIGAKMTISSYKSTNLLENDSLLEDKISIFL